MPGYQDAYGGVLAAEHFGGVASHRAVGAGTPQNAYVLAGGPDWVDAPVMCAYSMKQTGWPCDKEALPDTDHCLGHTRTAAKNQDQ